jgi:hypothetical protein
VQHTSELPRADRVYRCPTCRLNMKFDPVVRKMKPVSPNGNGTNGDKQPKVA